MLRLHTTHTPPPSPGGMEYARGVSNVADAYVKSFGEGDREGGEGRNKFFRTGILKGDVLLFFCHVDDDGGAGLLTYVVGVSICSRTMMSMITTDRNETEDVGHGHGHGHRRGTDTAHRGAKTDTAPRGARTDTAHRGAGTDTAHGHRRRTDTAHRENRFVFVVFHGESFSFFLFFLLN